MNAPGGLIELIPIHELYVDMRVLREEECQRCQRDQTIEYQLQSVRPRVWRYRCLECSRPRRESCSSE